MADLIFNFVQNKMAEVEHNGETIEAPIPRDLYKLNLNDPDAIIKQLREHGTLLRTLQDGVAQRRIGWRAHVRPDNLPPLEKGGNPRKVSIIADKENAIKRAQELPDPMKLPKKSLPKEEQAGQAMASMSDAEKRRTLKIAGFTEDQIEAIMNS
jgi:hypothetical protein